MRSWSRVHVPRVAGDPGPLNLFDTRLRAAATWEGGSTASLYVCGITPYDATHLGHAATYLAFDLLNRQWLDRGVQVTYVQNVTDVDDPLLERARATGESWEHLAERETQLFRDDMEALRILPPDHYVGVVESIPDVSGFLDTLSDSIYRVDDDWYLDVRADPQFGSVGSLDEVTMAALFAERGGDPDRPGKRDPLDSLVWRGPAGDDPSWGSAVGPGRPGWHIECAAIGVKFLGAPFDVQAGGADLMFPHHEMCATHVRLATGENAATTYLHAGMVGFRGAKMSKSLGNLVFVSRLRTNHDPAAIRLALLSHHYRSDWEWTGHDLPYAEARLTRWRAGVARASTPPAEDLLARLRSALSADLNAPVALAAIDEWCASVGEANDGDLVRDAVDALLGVAL